MGVCGFRYGEGAGGEAEGEKAGSLTLAQLEGTLAKVKRQMRQQAAKDTKAFGGMFDRPNRERIYEDGEGDGDGDEDDSGGAAAAFGNDAPQTPLEGELDRLTALARDMHAAGQTEDAAQLMAAVEKAREHAKNPASRSRIDFRNPTPDMREDAAKMGCAA